MIGEMLAFFFQQITGQEENECKSFSSGWVDIVARSGTWVSKLKVVCSSVGMRVWLVGRIVLSSCPNATRDDLLSRSLRANCLFELLLTIFWLRLGRIGTQKT